MRNTSITLPDFLERTSSRLIEVLGSSDYSSIFVLCDEHTYQDCWPKLKSWHPSQFKDEQLIIVGAGEEHKTLRTAEFIWDALINNGADRYSLLINLGGGMITDLGAFAASLFQRGIDFIHLPTSLLAIVDAAIGGKSGIDLENLKNMIGTFEQPKAILVFADFLESLDEEEYLSGMAEVYKHALIMDSNLWAALKEKDGLRIQLELIQKAAKIKSDIVQQDPLESSIRKILNFGHTIGHAIESNFLAYYHPIPHGFAIGIGMICEAYLSRRINGLSSEEFQDIVVHLKKNFPKLEWTRNDEKEMIKMIQKDKKNRAGVIKMVLLDALGKASFDHDVEEDMILAALKFYREQC
jgi:3-dehydroquinate synthase